MSDLRYAYVLDLTGPLAGVRRANQDLTSSHAVAERPLVRIRRDTDRERVHAAVRRHAREATCTGVRVRRGETRAVVVRALHHVAVNRVRLEPVKLGRVQARAALERIQSVLGRVRIRQRARLDVRHMTAAGGAHAHALIAEGHVDERLLVVMVASTAAVRVVVLALELVLDPLAVGSVPDERQDGADALDEEGALAGLSVIQGSLRHSRSANPTR